GSLSSAPVPYTTPFRSAASRHGPLWTTVASKVTPQADREPQRRRRRARPWRGAGVVERDGLENRCVATLHRGFESHPLRHDRPPDRKSTRLNSSHVKIS